MAIFGNKTWKVSKIFLKIFFFLNIFSGIPTFCYFSHEKQHSGFCRKRWDKSFFGNFSQKKSHVLGVRVCNILYFCWKFRHTHLFLLIVYLNLCNFYWPNTCNKDIQLNRN
jgi:hypothetical protein